MFGSGPTLENMMYDLDPEGWSPQEFHPSDRIRARYIFATFREDILGVQMGPIDGRNEGLIR